MTETMTPVAALFREWQRIEAEANKPELTDDEVDRLCAESAVVELRINSTPAQSIEDVVMKLCVATEFGFYVIDDTYKVGWAEARKMISEVAA